MISPHKKTINNQEGAAMIEFAIILPLLLLFIFGIIEFSLALFNQQVITNAAREGARRGVIMRDDRDVGFENGEIRTRIKEFASSYLVTFEDYTFDALDPDKEDVKITREDPDVPFAFGSDLTIEIKFPYKFVFLSPILELMNLQSLATINLQSVSTMRME